MIRRFLTESVSIFLIGACFAGLPALAGELHVAPQGKDTNAGTRAAPLATLTAARDAIRKLRSEGKAAAGADAAAAAAVKPEAFTIWVHAGTFEVTEMLVLEAQDSGSLEAPVVIRVYEDDTPLLVGAPKVTDFVPHKDQIMKADVSALGLKDITIRQLLFKGERQTLARYPNVDASDIRYKGWAFLDENPKELPADHDWKRNAQIKKEDVRQWAHPEEVEIDVFAQYGWWNWIMPVTSLDAATGKLTLAKPCGYDLHPHNRYYFQNALEELDAPGEWYLDKRTQTLYFWPPAPLNTGEVRIPKLATFIKIGPGAKHISIRGLHFTGCNSTAIYSESAENSGVEGCTLSHVGHFGGTGISLQGGKNNWARGNNVSYTGAAGISVGGGDRKTLTPSNNVVDNNHIHNVGVVNKNGAGVGLGGVGNEVTHNLIHHTPRMGIQFAGNNLVIEYNHIHHTVLETQDGGAVYTGGRDWISSRGTKLRYNFIHDTVGVGQGPEGLHWPHFTWGIYMDDNAGGLDIVGNIVTRSARASLHLHNGRDHLIENNIFAEGGERQIEFNGWRKEHSFFSSHLPTMIAGWDSIKDAPAWKGMRNIEFDPRNAIREDGTMMSGNVFQKNIILWSDPNLRYLDLRSCSPKYNLTKSNLLWNGGSPILTAVSKTGPNVGPELLHTDELLKTTENGKTPKGWGWNHKPLPDLQIIATDGVIEVPAATGPDPKNVKSVIHFPALPFKPGAAFRGKLKVRGTEPSAKLTFEYGVYANPGGYFATQNQTVMATPEWQEVEVMGVFPAEGDAKYKPWMKTFWLRMDVHAEKGKIQLQDISLHEAEALSNWASWQTEGWDKDSIVANPSFVAADEDDFRLNPDSPAKKIGFEPLPLDKMGLYPDELRAK